MRDELASIRLSEYARLNRRFHRVIYRASQRDYLVRALDQIWSAFPAIVMSYFAQTTDKTLAERMAHDLKEQAAIITALESGDSEGAVRLLQQHIEENRNELLSVLMAQS